MKLQVTGLGPDGGQRLVGQFLPACERPVPGGLVAGDERRSALGITSAAPRSLDAGPVRRRGALLGGAAVVGLGVGLVVFGGCPGPGAQLAGAGAGDAG